MKHARVKRFLPFASLASGFAVMGSEVAAGRLLAPSFGTSTLVWSALIGVVLGGLALGALLGGLWSRRDSALREAFAATVVAGVVLGTLPAVARPLMRTTMEQFLRGNVALLALGFALVLVLLVVPVVILGAMSPILVHHATGDRSDVGRTAGRLSALGTVGSLLGTFACGIVLVPLLGTEATFRICGVVVLVIGAVGSFLAMRASGAPATKRSPLAVGATLAVIALVLALVAVAMVQKPHGGSGAVVFERETLPEAKVVAVELDAGVVDVARTYFGLPASVEVHVEDARAFLARDTRTYDLVVVDAFQFPYVPFQLTTRELFEDVRRHMSEGGALMVNAGRKGQDLDVVHAVASTLQTVFPHVNGANVAQTTNTILVASDHGLEDAGGERNVRFTEAERAELVALEPLAPWVVPASKRLVLTDDCAPVEWLTNRIVMRELARMVRGRS